VQCGAERLPRHYVPRNDGKGRRLAATKALDIPLKKWYSYVSISYNVHQDTNEADARKQLVHPVCSIQESN
jgi:hypothetical protein